MIATTPQGRVESVSSRTRDGHGNNEKGAQEPSQKTKQDLGLK